MTLFQLMHHDVIHRLGWTLVHTVWQASIVAVLLAMVLRLCERKSSRLRYVLSYVAMLAIVGMAIVTFIMQQSSSGDVPANGGALPVVMNAPAVPAPQVTEPSWDGSELLPWVVSAWIVGVIFISAWQLAAWISLRRHCVSATPAGSDWLDRLAALAGKMNIRQKIELALTDRLEVPVVVGAIRPYVLMPVAMLNNLTVQQVEAILAHELAHIRRHDYLANLIQVAIETLMFYHPAVWWISRQIRREREFCCDDLAIEISGDRVGYARSLTALEQARVGSSVVPAANGSGELLMRVRRLVGETPHGALRRTERSSAWTFAMALAVTTVLLCGTMLTGQPATTGLPTTAPSGAADALAAQIERQAVARVKAEEEVWGALNQQIEGGIALTPSVVQFQIDQAAKIYAAKADAYRDPAARVAAAQEYLDRCVTLANVLYMRRMQDVTRVQLSQGNAAVEQAKILLLRAKTEAVSAQSTGSPLKPFRIIVTANEIIIEDKPVTWADARKVLAVMPQEERKRTYLEIATRDGNLPVQKYFQAQAEADKLVTELGLAYVSQVGVESTSK